MKVLLVNSNMEIFPVLPFPMGLYHVATSINNHDVIFLNLILHSNPEGELKRNIKEFIPDVICVSIRNIDNSDSLHPRFYIDDIKKSVVDVIKRNSKAPIVIGGPAVNVNPVEIMEYLGVDFGVYGEGENIINDILDSIASRSIPSHITGAIYRDNGKIVVNTINRVDGCHTIDFSKKHDSLKLKMNFGKSTNINVQTKRGCNFKCVYCTYNRIEGTNIRLKDPKDVVDEIEFFSDNTGSKVVEFTDSVFNYPLGHSIAICKEIVSRNLKLKFTTMGILPHLVTDELVDNMQQAGFVEIGISPESASDNVLTNLGKCFTKDDVVRAAGILRKSGMSVIWTFMFGGPGETKETVNETLDFIFKYVPEDNMVVAVEGIRIYKGTPLIDIAIKDGIITQDTNLLYPVFYFSKETDKEYLRKTLSKISEKKANFTFMEDGHLNGAERIIAKLATLYIMITGSKRPAWYYGLKIKGLSH